VMEQVPVKDANGEPVLDPNGNPRLEPRFKPQYVVATAADGTVSVITGVNDGAVGVDAAPFKLF